MSVLNARKHVPARISIAISTGSEGMICSLISGEFEIKIPSPGVWHPNYGPSFPNTGTIVPTIAKNVTKCFAGALVRRYSW